MTAESNGAIAIKATMLAPRLNKGIGTAVFMGNITKETSVLFTVVLATWFFAD